MAVGRHLNVTVWNEHVHERREPSVTKIYPDGMREKSPSASPR